MIFGSSHRHVKLGSYFLYKFCVIDLVRLASFVKPLEYQMVFNLRVGAKEFDKIFWRQMTFLISIELLEGFSKVKERILEHASPHLLDHLFNLKVKLPCLPVQISRLLRKDLVERHVELGVPWLPLAQLGHIPLITGRKSIAEFAIFDLIFLIFVKSLYEQNYIVIVELQLLAK